MNKLDYTGEGLTSNSPELGLLRNIFVDLKLQICVMYVKLMD